MKNKNPKVLLRCGDMRAVAQRTNPEFLDDKLKEIVERMGGDTEDTYQIVHAIYPSKRRVRRKIDGQVVFQMVPCVGRKPSIWFRGGMNSQYNDNNIRVIMDVYRKFRKRQPLIVELKYGTYDTQSIWAARRKRA